MTKLIPTQQFFLKRILFLIFKGLTHHQLANGGGPTHPNQQINQGNTTGPPCSTVIHMGLGQYMSEQEHFKNLFTV